MSSSKGSSKSTRSSSSAGEDLDRNSSSPVVASDGPSNSAAMSSPASSWYPGGGGYGYPGYSSSQQPGAYSGYPQWNPYTAHYPGYGGYPGWDYASGSNPTAPPPPPGSTSVTSPLPAPPPPPPSTTSNKSSTESRDKSSSSATKLPQPPLPPLPPPAFGLPPPPPPGPPPPPSSLVPAASTNDELKPKEKESREERKRRKKEKRKKEREERERDRAHRSKHEKTSSSDGIPTVKSYAAAVKESSSSKEDKVTDSKNKSSSKEETPTCASPPDPPAVVLTTTTTTAAAATSPPGVTAVASGVVFPPPDFSKPPPPPPPPPMSSKDQSDGKLGSAAETSGHPPLQPPPMPPPYGAFDLNVPPPGFTPPNFPPPKHGFHNMGGPGGPPGPYGGGFSNNWYDDQRGIPPGIGRFGRPGGPYNSPFGKPPGEDEGGQHGARTAPYDEIGEGRHPSGGPGAGHIKFNFPAKNSFTKQNALLETPPTKPQWNANRLGGDIRGGMYRDSPMMDRQGDRDNAMGPRGPNRRNMNNWRADTHSEGVMPGPGGMRDEQTATPKPLMARLENTNFGGKIPSKDSLAKGCAGPANKQQQSQQDVANMMKGEWPDALKRYVERCFAKCVTDLDKDQVEIVLKGKLTAAAKTGTLWTHKWDAEPMPNVHSDDMFAKIRSQFPTRSADTNSVSNSTTTVTNSSNNNNSITTSKGSPDKRSSDLGGRGRRGHRQHGSRFSRSRSRSRSPYGRDARHRRDSRRRYSPSPDDSRSTNSNNVIPLNNNNCRGAKRGRGSAFSRGGSMSSRLSHTNVKDDDFSSPTKDKEPGEPKLNAYGGPEEDVFGVASPPSFKMDANKQPNKKMRMDGKEKDPRNDIYFYSKGGKMTLDADLATAAHLQKRAARFQGMVSGGGAGPAAAAPPPLVTAPSATSASVGRGRGNRGGLLSRRGRGRGRGAAASVAAAVTTTPSIVATINASLFAVDTGDMDWTAMHVVGTCTEIKKQYLRLTSAPDPSTVRTLATLYKSLDFVKNDWVEKKDYRYTCNQMKSIRQDLTVQGIRDSFTIQVYEAHCRIALETADHEEFNQCQSQLKQLYAEVPGAPNALEFMAYRMLYYIFTKNTLDMTSLMAELTPKQKADECIAFALNLRAAWAMSNYYRFFKLFKNAPKMTGYLVDWFAERERKTAIKIMVKGYRPGSIAIEYVKSQLAIADSEWAKFADPLGVLYTDNTRTSIDCKTTVLAA